MHIGKRLQLITGALDEVPLQSPSSTISLMSGDVHIGDISIFVPRVSRIIDVGRTVYDRSVGPLPGGRIPIERMLVDDQAIVQAFTRSLEEQAINGGPIVTNVAVSSCEHGGYEVSATLFLPEPLTFIRPHFSMGCSVLPPSICSLCGSVAPCSHVGETNDAR